MGQQQLLLLVLGAIIVGVAIVVGINMFSSSALQANIDSVRQDCLMISSRIHEWYRKPAILGGGGHSFATVTFPNIGIDKDSDGTALTNDLTYENEHGTFTLTVGTSTVTVAGVAKEVDSDGNTVTISYTVSAHNVTETVTTP